METGAVDKDVEIPLLKARSATPDITHVETKNKRSTQAIDALFWKRARVLISARASAAGKVTRQYECTFCSPLIVSSYFNFQMATTIMTEFYSPLLRCTTCPSIGLIFIFMLKYAVLVSLKIIIGYFGAKLRLEWRTILVTKIQSQIYSQKNLANYLVNIKNCVDNVDQRVAEDVEVTTVFLWQFFLATQPAKE